MDGWNDEDHLIAAIWNLCGLAWTEEKKPELVDIPARQQSDWVNWQKEAERLKAENKALNDMIERLNDRIAILMET